MFPRYNLATPPLLAQVELPAPTGALKQTSFASAQILPWCL